MGCALDHPPRVIARGRMKYDAPSEIPHRLRLALFRRVILSVVEIRATRGSNNAKRCLGSRRKSSTPLHSAQDDTLNDANQKYV